MKDIKHTINKHKEFNQKEFLENLKEEGYDSPDLDIKSLLTWIILKYRLQFHIRLYRTCFSNESFRITFLYNPEYMNPNFYYIMFDIILKEFKDEKY